MPHPLTLHSMRSVALYMVCIHQISGPVVLTCDPLSIN